MASKQEALKELARRELARRQTAQTASQMGGELDDPMRQQAEQMATQIEQFKGQGGAGDLFQNAFSLGLQDKIAGLTEGAKEAIGGGSFGKGYHRGSLAQQILEERARERSGTAGQAAEIAGTLATGVLAKAPAAASTLARIGQTAKESAVLGGIQSGGESEKETIGGVGSDVLTGAGISGLLGGSFQGGLEAIRPLVKGGIGIFRGLTDFGGGPESRAAQKVTKSLADDSMTPAKIASRMRRGEGPLVAQADESTTRLGRAVSSRPGAGSRMLDRSLDAQQKASADRAVAAVNETLGGADVPFNKRIGQMIARRGQGAEQAYQTAFRQNFQRGHSSVFDDLAKRVPPEAVRNAARIARAEGRPFGEQLIASLDETAGTVRFRREPSLREWHYIQRGLRSAADSAYRSGVGEVGTAYKNLHKGILQAMDDANPTYRLARRAYASESQMIDALKRGREIMTPAVLRNLDNMADELSTLSMPEKEMVRVGLARGLEDMIQSTPDEAGDVIRKIFGTPQKRDAIKAVFENDSTFRKFQAQMMRIAKGGKAFRMIRTGSRTAMVENEKSAFGALADVGDLATSGGIANMTIRGVNKLLRNLGGMDEDTSVAIAKILVEENPDEVMRALAGAIRTGARRAATDQLLIKAKQLARGLTVGGSAGIGSSRVSSE